jgi:CDP-glycerol glycerophosphotransferase (TagB/SpsB family)
LKFNKHNPIHYLYFLYLSINLVFATVFIKLLNLKSKESQIALTGHYFNDNILLIYHEIENSSKLDPFYLTFSINDYRKLKKEISVLFIGNPIHLIRILRSGTFVVAMGLHLHKLLKKTFNFRSIYINHGLFMGDLYSLKLRKEYSTYDEIWHFSNFEKKIFKKNLLTSTTEQIVTGFPITQYYNSKIQHLKPSKNKSCIVAFSSTNTKVFKNKKFSMNNPEFIDKLEEIGNVFKINFIIKPHPSSKFLTSIKNKISNSKYVKFLNTSTFSSLDYNFLSADFMITDISTVYVHFLLVSKPILFISPENNSLENANGFLLNSFIERCNDYKSFEQMIFEIVENNYEIDTKLLELKNLIYKDLEIDKIFSNCLNRLDKQKL